MRSDVTDPVDFFTIMFFLEMLLRYSFYMNKIDGTG